MRFFIILAFLFSSSALLFSQTETKDVFSDIVVNKAGQGNISIVQSSNIKKIVNTHVEGVALRKGIPGYRIQIYSGSSRSARSGALQLISSFRNDFKNVEPHLVYNEPNFKVRVGDFRTKSEALKFMEKLIKTHNSAFIVKDYIDFPKVY